MGVSRQQAAENRSAIVAAAERLFRARGVDAVGLAELMKEAGFTQGGFYNHFKSKDALVAAVMEKAMEDYADSPNAGSLAKQAARYLSTRHRGNIEAGCPLSGFAGDVPRMSDAARASYTRGLAAYLRGRRNGEAEPSRCHRGVQPDGRRTRVVACGRERRSRLRRRDPGGGAPHACR
jgi:TetR/AcrR family transcriptional repressor of nem operon